MVDRKNELAGILAIVGFLSIVITVSGVAAILDVVVGSGNTVVVVVTGNGTLAGLGAAGGGEGGVLGAAILTTVGVAGILAVRSAIESGYFDPEDTADQPADAGESTETESDAEPA